MPQAPEFWTKRGLVSGMLTPFGWAHGALGTIRRGMVQAIRVGVPVICIGNLVAGGAGKTPVVLSLAALLKQRGRQPHILSRGYGGSLTGPLRVDPAQHTARDVGDEPLLLAQAAPTWIGRDRVASARAAIAAGADLLLLDDGFQNPALHYNRSLLVVDGGYGIGNGRVIPAGPLREPIAQALPRADAIVMIGDSAEAPRLDGVPQLTARLAPIDGDEMKGKCVVAFAGIGRPAKFFATLNELGATIILQRGFADHHAYHESDIVHLAAVAEQQNAMLVTTEKDYVRLPPGWDQKIRTLKVALRWDDEAALLQLLAPVLVTAHG